MRAVYTIKSCCGNSMETVIVELPTGMDDPTGNDALTYALSQSHYTVMRKTGYCKGCRNSEVKGNPEAHAVFYGFPLDPVPATVTIEAVDRDALVETLESLLVQVRDLPNYVSEINCDDGHDWHAVAG
jgi:hypothetical protein